MPLISTDLAERLSNPLCGIGPPIAPDLQRVLDIREAIRKGATVKPDKEITVPTLRSKTRRVITKWRLGIPKEYRS